MAPPDRHNGARPGGGSGAGLETGRAAHESEAHRTATPPTRTDTRPTVAAFRPAWWSADQGARATRRLDAIYAAIANARPGDVLTEGEGWRWMVYRLGDGRTVAACYLAGRLLRRDPRGWFVVDYRGKRQAVKGDPVARLAGTAPAGWPRHPEHLELGGGVHG